MNFNEFLLQNLPNYKSFHPHFNEALKYTLSAGGKHFRANLLLGVVLALKPEFYQKAMRVALGVEFLHTYSLIHDDLPAMDNSPLRRGIATLHTKFDEVTAILVGDALNTAAFFEISKADLDPKVKIRCVEILSQNGGIDGMVLGQALDCYFEKKPLNLEELKFLHIHKTGKLIAASLKMGAVIAMASEELCDTIYKIGLDLGLAFQIEDDLIDATSSEFEAGKPVNNDSIKNSFTNLLGIDGAKKAKNELIYKIKNEIENLPTELKNELRKLVDNYFK